MPKMMYDVIWDECLKEVINPIFKENGYKRSGNSYYKKREDFWLCANFQSRVMLCSKEFTFNFGVCHPKAYELFHGVALPSAPKPWYTIDYMRVGRLIRVGDYWYKVGELTDKVRLKDEIKSHLNNFIIPYLEQFKATQNIIDIFDCEKPIDIYQYIALLFLSNYKEKAFIRLKNNHEKLIRECNILWKEKTEEFASRLGFKLD